MDTGYRNSQKNGDTETAQVMGNIIDFHPSETVKLIKEKYH